MILKIKNPEQIALLVMLFGSFRTVNSWQSIPFFISKKRLEAFINDITPIYQSVYKKLRRKGWSIAEIPKIYVLTCSAQVKSGQVWKVLKNWPKIWTCINMSVFGLVRPFHVITEWPWLNLLFRLLILSNNQTYNRKTRFPFNAVI